MKRVWPRCRNRNDFLRPTTYWLGEGSNPSELVTANAHAEARASQTHEKPIGEERRFEIDGMECEPPWSGDRRTVTMEKPTAENLSPSGNGSSAGQNEESSIDMHHAFLRWASLSILSLVSSFFFIAFFALVLVAALQTAVNLEEVVFTLVAFGFLMGMGISLVYACLNSIMEKMTIRRDISDIEEETSRLHDGEPPSELLIGSLSELRDSLMKYATSSYGISPMAGFYESRLRRRIDFAFSCVSEALYRRYWDEKRRGDPGTETEVCGGRQPGQFGYKTLNTWILALRTHLVGSRKWLRYSSKEISTLLYFFEDWRVFFKKSHKDIFDEYREAVDKFHDHREESAELESRRRKELIMELARQMFVGLLLLIIGYLLGLGANGAWPG